MPEERERLFQIKNNLVRRAHVFALVRQFFSDCGFLEVETPSRVPAIAPEKHIEPVTCGEWYLTPSPELHMKRLLACGYDRIFQVSRAFRRGEKGRLHNPEFSLLEWYRTKSDYKDIVEDTEQLLSFIMQNIYHSHNLPYQTQTIDMRTPWPRLTVRDAFLQYANWDPIEHYNDERFDYDMAISVIPAFDTSRPTVLTDYPAAAASLAKLSHDNPKTAERAEVFIGGIEVANIYSELNNATEQRKRFASEAEKIEKTRQRKMPISEPFIAALDHLPDCAGVALGMDRLVMLMCDAAFLCEVCTFTEENI